MKIVMRVRRLLATCLFVLMLPVAAIAQTINADGGVAIKGTDVVAYFTDQRAVAGSRTFTHKWNGAEWRFVSAANRDAFVADPEKYAPQYGGFCAWGMAEGYRAPIDPAAFRIVDNRLYLNYSRSVQSNWLKDVPGHVAKGDANWPKLREK